MYPPNRATDNGFPVCNAEQDYRSGTGGLPLWAVAYNAGIQVRIMRKSIVTLIVACTLAAMVPIGAQAQQKAPEPLKLKVGDMAPDFHLKYFDGAKLQDVSLSDFKGKKNVVLAFFVFAFTGG
jgi:hypothetical protein